jgi:hypothetical protein
MVDRPKLSDDELLDRLQRAAFDYFLSNYSPANDGCRRSQRRRIQQCQMDLNT